jgi:hypothetical protein
VADTVTMAASRGIGLVGPGGYGLAAESVKVSNRPRRGNYRGVSAWIPH